MEHVYFRNQEDRETDNWNNLTEEERNFKQQKMAEDNKDMKTTNRLKSELSESKELVEVSKISDVKEFERLTDKHINWGFKKELMTSGGRGFNKYTTGLAALRQTKVNMSNDLLYNFEDQMSRTKSVNWRPTTKQSKSI